MVQHLRHRELTLLCLEMKRAAGSPKRGGGAWKSIIKDFKQGLGRLARSQWGSGANGEGRNEQE